MEKETTIWMAIDENGEIHLFNGGKPNPFLDSNSSEIFFEGKDEEAEYSIPALAKAHGLMNGALYRVTVQLEKDALSPECRADNDKVDFAIQGTTTTVPYGDWWKTNPGNEKEDDEDYSGTENFNGAVFSKTADDADNDVPLGIWSKLALKPHRLHFQCFHKNEKGEDVLFLCLQNGDVTDGFNELRDSLKEEGDALVFSVVLRAYPEDEESKALYCDVACEFLFSEGHFFGFKDLKTKK